MTRKSVAQNILVSALLICFFISPLYSKEKKSDYFDGPYVTWVNADTIVCVTVERIGGKKKINKKVLKAKDFASYAKTLPASELGYSLIDSKPEKSEFRADRIIAIGDLHGDLRNFKKLLINNGITDEKLNWKAGNTHLVMPGDAIDRGADSTECVWLIRKLEKQAATAGGKVHFLIGNHEYMVTQGDLRYIAKKYAKLHRYRYDKLYGKRTEFGKWLRTKNVLMKIGDYIFSHAGISPELAASKLTFDEINAFFRELIDLDFTYNEPDEEKEKIFRLLSKGNGPVWYRGYYKDKTLTNEKVESILKQFGGKKIILGHTKHKTITSLFGGRLLAIDVMDYSNPEKESGEALLIENNTFYRLTIDGKKEKLKL